MKDEDIHYEKCPACGSSISANESICPNCGLTLSVEAYQKNRKKQKLVLYVEENILKQL